MTRFRFESLPVASSSRSRLRRLLRQASRGETPAFAQLLEPYFDLITEYLYFCGFYKKRELLEKTDEVLAEVWKLLPFSHRVSHFERLLATVLFSVSGREPEEVESSEIQRFRLLDPGSKFALVANDFEKWDYAVTTAALRVSHRELSDILFKARCRLLDTDPATMDSDHADCVRKLSVDLDGQSPNREKKKLCRRLKAAPRAKEFKSACLELRCRLIELRQQIRFSEADKHAFLERIPEKFRAEDMIQVHLLERFANRLISRKASATNL